MDGERRPSKVIPSKSYWLILITIGAIANISEDLTLGKTHASADILSF